MPPLPKNFPARNRIISGLSDLVLVVEAREKSGSLITADFALEQGKDIYAVPGRVNDELSRGCLHLIRQGAGVADSPETILDALKISLKTENKELNEKETKILLAKDENIVYSWIRLQPVSLDELVCKTGLPVSQVLSILVELELKGCIREVQKNEYIKQT
jgi:DNA processing protein